MKFKLESVNMINNFYKGLLISMVISPFLGYMLSGVIYVGAPRFSPVFSIIVFLGMSFSMFLTHRRFLRKITYNYSTKFIETTSIISFVKKKINIDDIEEIKLIQSVGIKNTTNGFRHLNLVIRISKNFQPQIFEVKNHGNLKSAEQLIEIINGAKEGYH